MDDDVAAVVRRLPSLYQSRADSYVRQVIDNGSGMCKAGCKSFYTVTQLPLTDSSSRRFVRLRHLEFDLLTATGDDAPRAVFP